MIYEVLIDRGETPNKCTIAPLAGRADLRICRTLHWEVSSPVLLHPDGVCLSTVIGKGQFTEPPSGIAAIDCIWRRLPSMLQRLKTSPHPVYARLPDGLVTAYPRVSKVVDDPAGGLATIEALFAGAAMLGHIDPSLFSAYYFGREFVERNLQRFRELGVTNLSPEQIEFVPRQRHARQRRVDRGGY
jgi:pre-rRNA-processing protein TSR3